MFLLPLPATAYRPLLPSELRRLKSDRYAVIPNWLTPAEVDALRADALAVDAASGRECGVGVPSSGTNARRVRAPLAPVRAVPAAATRRGLGRAAPDLLRRRRHAARRAAGVRGIGAARAGRLRDRAHLPAVPGGRPLHAPPRRAARRRRLGAQGAARHRRRLAERRRDAPRDLVHPLPQPRVGRGGRRPPPLLARGRAPLALAARAPAHAARRGRRVQRRHARAAPFGRRRAPGVRDARRAAVHRRLVPRAARDADPRPRRDEPAHAGIPRPRGHRRRVRRAVRGALRAGDARQQPPLRQPRDARRARAGRDEAGPRARQAAGARGSEGASV